MPLSSFTGSSTLTTAATSTSVNITSAVVGDWVYAFIVLDTNQTSVTMTGWTQILQGPEPTSSPVSYYALFRRLKQTGDTTFTVSWPTSARGTFGLIAYNGLNATTPDEGATMALHTTGTTYPTASLTPGGAQRWAVTFTYSRTSTTANKAIAFTPDAALTEKLDFNNSAAASSPWVGQEISDSNGMVTVAAHSYTATQAFTETHGGAILLYLVPATPVLLASYNFDEGSGNVLDRTGNGHDFQIGPTFGSSARTTGSGGHTGEGLTQTAADITTGSIFGQTPFRTLECWVKQASSATTWVIEHYVTSLTSGSWGILFLSGQVHIQARNSSNFFRASGTPTFGAWYHVAGTYDGVNVRLYLNGTLSATAACTAPLRTDADIFRVIDQGGSNTVIDDVRMYDQALDAASITNDMNTPVPSPAVTGFSGWGIPL